MKNLWFGLLWMAGMEILAGAAAALPIGEVEPNDPCSAAQNLGGPSLPFAVSGLIDGADVDFYRFQATPGTWVLVDLKGQGSQQGTLGDGLLAAFSLGCSEHLGTDDEGGAGHDSRLVARVPDSGALVLAATSFPDFGFTGEVDFGGGTYQLEVQELEVAAAVSGRVTDAKSGQPLASAFYHLDRCIDGSCQLVDSGFTDFQGRFRVESAPFFLLLTGEYRLVVQRDTYLSREVAFSLAADEELDLGDVALTPIPRLSSIEVRLVDSQTGAPLRGDAPPFAAVWLRYCEDEFFCFTVRFSELPDATGRVRFEGSPDAPLLAGSYRIEAFADQYEGAVSEPFQVKGSEDYNAGNFGLKSFPVRLVSLDSCAPIPASGGSCRFRVQVSNGMPAVLNAKVWTLLRAGFTGSPAGSSSFQAPGEKSVTLLPGQSAIVPFTINVPASLSAGAFVCADTYTAAGGRSFETLGAQTMLCLVKDFGGFATLTGDLRRELSLVKRAGGDAGLLRGPRPAPPVP